MLPDYIIYDELKREREDGDEYRDRPRKRLPRQPVPEFDDPEEHEQEEEDSNRGVTIIEI